MWENNDPVAYQGWSNVYQAKENVPSYCLIFHSKDSRHEYRREYYLNIPQCIHRSLKVWASENYFPTAMRGLYCDALLVSNLAEPDWIQVPCNRPLVTHVFCLQERKYNVDLIIKTHPKWEIYQKPCLHFLNRCYEIIFQSMGERKPCHVDKTLVASLLSIIPGFMIHLKQYSWKFNNESLRFCPELPVKIKLGSNLLKCNNNSFVSIAFFCDGIADCSSDNPLDEQDCKCKRNMATSCTHVTTYNKRLCSVFTHRSTNGTCQTFNFFDKLHLPHTETFQCPDGSNISNILLNDLVADCIIDAADEPILKTLNKRTFNCSTLDEIPCRAGHPRCYHVSDTCNYQLNSLNLLYPCRTGEHLQNCTKFKCNMKFKCPGYYCIPWGYLCDGKWDCPSGYDESSLHKCNETRGCINMFKCRFSQVCSHMFDVCSTVIDCPLGDDEQFCSLKDITCPEKCHCLIFAIKCIRAFQFDDILSLQIVPFYVIYLQWCSYSFAEAFISKLKILVSLSATFSNIDDICRTLHHFTILETITIDLSHNNISMIHQKCFQNALKLKVINISNNILSKIEKSAFKNLASLVYLNLKNNDLSIFSAEMIINCPSLSLLVLDRNQFIEISPGAFQQMFLQYVISNDYRICCIVQAGTQCLSKSTKYKTCHQLLNNNTLKIAYITFSLIVIILNFVSLVLQKVIFNQLYHSYEMIAGSINILDLGWGLYLSIIWVAHVTYTTNYVFKDTMWLQTPFCFLAFGIALYYIILSPLSLCFLSFCRLSVV